MKNDANSGITDKNGHWRPSSPVKYSPLFEKDRTLVGFLRFWFGWGGFIFPRHLMYTALAFLTFYFLQPGFSVTAALGVRWVLLMLLRNIVLLWIISGSYHLALYTFKLHGTKQKYHPKWQAADNKLFLFRNQTWDNIFRSTVSGALVWTAYEVLYFWLAARGRIPLLSMQEHPFWFGAWFFLIPLWRETHFYFSHKLLHWKPLFRAFHKVHHLNHNPGPWSGMSMHTVEHILYFSCVLIHFVIPSHPIHLLYDSQLTALTPAQGHSGFHGPLFRGWLPVGDYFHYLHHKHVTCNFGVNTIPWDRWFGRFYNGEGGYKTKEKGRG